MAVLQDDQKATINAAATDAAGESVAESFTFAAGGALGAEGNAVITVVDNGDGTSSVEGNDVGSDKLTASAVDADGNPVLGADGNQLSASIQIDVVASAATGVTLGIGAPGPK